MKRSAFPLLLACWTALFLATSKCSSVTKLPPDSRPAMYCMHGCSEEDWNDNNDVLLLI